MNAEQLGVGVKKSLAEIAPQVDYLDVTELAGEPISPEQVQRMQHRYDWAAQYCGGKSVLELGCGTGPGLGILASVAKRLEASDFSEAMIARVREHYGNRISLVKCDAAEMPFEDRSAEVVILFEAIYYLPDIAKFIRECQRVLVPGGAVLISTANKDLADFNPSPHSHRYLGVRELAAEFGRFDFDVECFGYMSTRTVSIRQRILRPVKRFVVNAGLMPKTMRGKQLLKRIVFGKAVVMPAELKASDTVIELPVPLDTDRADETFKVIYCRATLSEQSRP